MPRVPATSSENRSAPPQRSLLNRLSQSLDRPIDSAILAYFRILFGALMAYEISRYLISGNVSYLWADPTFHFKYYGFGWVQALPGYGIHAVCILMILAAVGIGIGWRYRINAAVFATGMTYLFLLDQAKYMNHFYLICLLAWVSVLLPAHAAFSVDASRNPKIRSDHAPAWTIGLLRFQVGVVYFFGGIAKINADWLRGDPMRAWLHNRADTPIVGSWFETPSAPYFFSYGGLLFDLLVVPALLWKPTRLAAFATAVAFHLSNSQMFSIGIFPWLAIALTALFFHPSWPRRALAKFGRIRTTTVAPASPRPPIRKAWIALLVTYAIIQITVPLRHFLYPGNVSWTEQGHRFSWHMMLRSKQTIAASFFVIDPASGERWKVDPGAYLTPRQFEKMLGRPDMIQQFAAHIANEMENVGYPGTQVRAVVYCSLNSRPPAILIDPTADLASVPRSLSHAPWILPLDCTSQTQPPPPESPLQASASNPHAR